MVLNILLRDLLDNRRECLKKDYVRLSSTSKRALHDHWVSLAMITSGARLRAIGWSGGVATISSVAGMDRSGDPRRGVCRV
jgi:hypothetical protein